MKISRRSFVMSVPAAICLVAMAAATGCSGDSDEGVEEAGSDASTDDTAVVEDVGQEEGQSGRYFAQDAPAEAGPYLREGGWSYIDGESPSVNFAVILGCNDQVNCYVLMTLRVTALGADGSVLASQSVGVEFIAPDDVMPVTGSLSVASEPAELAYELSAGEGSPPGNPYTLADLPVSNVSEIVGDIETHWTGEIANNCGVDFAYGAYPVVILRSGSEIVGGASRAIEFRTSLENGASTYFDLGEYNSLVPDHDSFEVIAVPNLI